MTDVTERQEGVEEIAAAIERIEQMAPPIPTDPDGIWWAESSVWTVDIRLLLAEYRTERSARLAADAAGYRRGLEEAARLALQKRDGYRAATHPRGPMRYRAEGMAVAADFIADAIRALPRASSASQGER
jgi:hypothetical protein